ncbi:MAG: methionyl-tRNA formyltransferase [Clostridiales bacterium]|nr:methionyl-tRNA formyltransferase [Clostridiales bacterium]
MRIVFMGTPDFAACVLRSLVKAEYEIVCCVTQPDKPQGRKMILTPPPAKEVATEFGIPVWQPASLRTPEALEQLKEYAPDLIITAAYGKILPKTMLDLPKYGCVNVHGSLLPKYRGAAPVQWSILNRDEKTGVTIMKMDEGMDTGDILTSEAITIDRRIHTPQLMDQLANVGADLLIRTLPDYLDGKITPVAQDNDQATVSPPITKEQGKINWNDPADVIDAQVRALSEWPGAVTMWKGAKLKIYDAYADPACESLLANYREAHGEPLPGTVIAAKKGTLAVMCQDRPILLLELQPASGKRMKAIDCAHNYEVGKQMEDEA